MEEDEKIVAPVEEVQDNNAGAPAPAEEEPSAEQILNVLLGVTE